MQPRDRSEAARTVFTLTTVATLVTGICSVLSPASADGRVILARVTLPVLLGIAMAAWLLRHVRSNHKLGWVLFPFAAIIVVATLDLLTEDVSVGAQVFLLFPALYGASQLPRAGAVAVTAACVLGDAVVVFALLPVATALQNATYVAASLMTGAGLLIVSGERREVLISRLRCQAALDPLTCLVTRRVLDDAARSALSGAASSEGTSLILLDIDRFKTVNDVHGHLAGDEVLIQLAAILTRNARADDVVSRMGGDEIAVLLPGCSVRVAWQRAQQICDDVRTHLFVLTEGPALSLSASLGVSHAPTHAADLRPLYAAADFALYQAKRAGRGRVAMMPRVINDELNERLASAAS